MFRFPLPFHVAAARLGIGDLHPGGAAESERLVDALRERAPGRALEIGAGAGFSTERLVSAGFEVKVVEREPLLASRFRRPGVEVFTGLLADLPVGDPVDVVLAESVLYARPPDESFAAIARHLRPGGFLAFVDMVWTERATPEGARQLHDRSLEAFGIPLAPREPSTWSDWRARLVAHGFRIREERRLGKGSPGGSTRRGSRWLCPLRHPLAALSLGIQRTRESSVRPPDGWLESWSCVAEFERRA